MYRQYLNAALIGLLVVGGTTLIAGQARLESRFIPVPAELAAGSAASYAPTPPDAAGDLVAIRLDATAGAVSAAVATTPRTTNAPLKADSVIVERPAPRQMTPLEVVWSFGGPWSRAATRES
jgi:hypothetical protein